MTTFKIGQRVRLVKNYLAVNNNAECVITSFFKERESGIKGWPINCYVTGAVKGTATHTDRIEPIIPEGMQPCTWEECLWQPEQNTEKVYV